MVVGLSSLKHRRLRKTGMTDHLHYNTPKNDANAPRGDGDVRGA